MRGILRGVVVAGLMVACGESGEHPGTPVDPVKNEVLVAEACIEMEAISNRLQSKQDPCSWDIREPIPHFSDSPICRSGPESWGQRCLEEEAAREVLRACVDSLPVCLPDGSFEEDWTSFARGCVFRWRAALIDPSCDVFPYIQR